MYEVGDTALLTRLLGEEIDPPHQVQVLQVRSYQSDLTWLLDYEVLIPRVQAIETGRQVENLHVWVRDAWLVPAEIRIDEDPEWPFDE